jgi:nuclear GTP-binding protein
VTQLEAQSKRLPASHKYKVQKKVAEYRRKARKEAKKNPNRRKLKKDPGIPNLFPFKEKLMLQAQEAQQVMID